MWRVAVASGLLLATLGCRNQTSTVTNPFLTPDRVPPPATRMPAPGTAQPYYPGDPVPGAATAPPTTFLPTTPGPLATPNLASPPAGAAYPAYQPGAAFSPSTVPPATSYPGATAPQAAPLPSYPAGSAPVSPPGGWGTYPPQTQFTPVGPVPSPAFAPSFVPSQTGWSNGGVTPAEYQSASSAGASPTATLTASNSSGDGFRPMGSPRLEPSAPATPADSGFRPPRVASDGAGPTATVPFAADSQYAWLRGQLEYWPESGQWTMRYLDAGQADMYGGRVMIDNPQTLGNLPPGEMVVVRGQIFGRQLDDEHYLPAYRVSAVERQRR